MILEKFAFSFAFDLRKQDVKDFSFIYIYIFSIRVFFTDTYDSQDSRKREGAIYSTLPLPPAHEH